MLASMLDIRPVRSAREHVMMRTKTAEHGLTRDSVNLESIRTTCSLDARNPVKFVNHQIVGRVFILTD